MLLSGRKFAKQVGMSHTYINKMVKQGVIPLHGKKIDLDEGVRLLDANRDPSRDAQREANAKRRKPSGLWSEENMPDESLADMTAEERAEYDRQMLSSEQDKLHSVREDAKAAGADVGMDKMPASINKVKIFRELYMGKIAQLDFKRKSGDLVDRMDVERDGYEAGRLIRDNLLAFPHKMSIKVAGMIKPKEIELIMEREIQDILENLSNA